MNRTPTLPDLALYARDHFGEGGAPFEDSLPTSLDVVVAVYAGPAEAATPSVQAGAALRQHLQNRGCHASPEEVDIYVQGAVRYLQALYPEREALWQEERQRFLSHLFWGNLVEMRHASAQVDATLGSEQTGTHTSQRPRAVRGSQDRDEQRQQETRTPSDRETREVGSGIAQRKYLVDALNEALPQMYHVYAGKGKAATLFLQRAITHHADAATLASILQDVQREIAGTEGVPSMPQRAR
jgi:hypothetical protein